MPRKKDTDTELAAAMTTAIASILGNIARAASHADTKAVAAALRADRDRLIRLLGRLEKTHQTLRARLAHTAATLAAAEREAGRLSEDADKLRRDYDMIAAESAKRDAEISALRARVMDLEAAADSVKGAARARP